MPDIRMPTQKRSIEKRNKIIEKGFELMCEKGFYNTTTTDIAEYAGVSIGIIYQYFNDKKDIFLEGVKNYSIAVKEKGEDIIFLRKIVEGGTDESYGIHVARLAGVPKVVTKRADEILRTLERKSMLSGKKQEKENKKVVEGQFDMFNFKLAEIAHEIDKINLNELTPIDALNTLVKIKEKMK